jgi:hypothetical protein
VFTIDGGSWSSKKQAVVALSTLKAEYIAATHAAKESLWICMFLAEVARPLALPVTLHWDNKSAISVTKNDQYHPRTKQIDIRYHFIRDAVCRRLIYVDYIPINETAADIFTKALPRAKVMHLRTPFGLRGSVAEANLG